MDKFDATSFQTSIFSYHPTVFDKLTRGLVFECVDEASATFQFVSQEGISRETAQKAGRLYYTKIKANLNMSSLPQHIQQNDRICSQRQIDFIESPSKDDGVNTYQLLKDSLLEEEFNIVRDRVLVKTPVPLFSLTENYIGSSMLQSLEEEAKFLAGGEIPEEYKAEDTKEQIRKLSYFIHDQNMINFFKALINWVDASSSDSPLEFHIGILLPREGQSITGAASNLKGWLIANCQSNETISKMTHLELKGAHLTRFPHLVRYFPNVDWLNFQENHIQVITEEEVQSLPPKLNVLYFAENPIKILPSNFTQLLEKKNIRAEWNQNCERQTFFGQLKAM